MGREEQFIRSYKPQWEQLEQYILKMDKKSYSSFTAGELKDYLSLMKRVSHHLAYSRTHFPQSALTGYLNELSVRAHNHLYVVKKSNGSEILRYFTSGFPERIRENRKFIFAAFVIFMIGFYVSLLLVLKNPTDASLFLPEAFTQQQDWDHMESSWQEEQFFFLSTMVMINNIGVVIKAFALSITAGIMTVYVLFMNGTMLGALSALVSQNTSNMLYFWALILPHGFIELSAIFVAGGAGLRVAKALLIPGPYKRVDSLIKEGKEAVMLMPGAIFMLVIAGLIEGFLTPAKIFMPVKLGFAFCTLVLLILYVVLRKKKEKAE